MAEEKTAGVPIVTILLTIFITLKLTHNIDWSWWWVLSPLWIYLSLIVLIILVILAIEDKRKDLIILAVTIILSTLFIIYLNNQS